jgi:uncharacterized protein (DUF2252 family)
MKDMPVTPAQRAKVLRRFQNQKMARSPHAYIRGTTVQFYRWLEELKRGSLPEGPSIWICGDCHVSNLGPLASAAGDVSISIRDLDQTVVGNPAHDIIRLGLSLASAARGSALPGVTTAQMLEHMIIGYTNALSRPNDAPAEGAPPAIHTVMRRAVKRTWRHLAKERIEDTRPTIPLGKRFWPLSRQETLAIARLFEAGELRRLATSLRDRDDDAAVRLLDAAYWRKGCSSLGRLRYCVLLEVGDDPSELCLMDLKEAIAPAAPRNRKAALPKDAAARVVEGARHLTPPLGDRMRPVTFLGKSVFVRELLPQDLKIDLDVLPADEARKIARFLAFAVGRAHAQQMDRSARQAWRKELKAATSKALDAPTWLWRSVVDLLSSYEREYLEHCRKYALQSG